MKSYLFFVFISITLLGAWGCSRRTHGAYWGYEGKYGPENWGDIKPEYLLCKVGENQSPVNITGAKKTNLADINFSYMDTSLQIINNGHTILLKYTPGSSITVDGQEYELLQFHFHTPSEHTENGQSFDMEMHLVHKNLEGNAAVVAVFFQEGKYNNALGALWEHIPPKNIRAKASRKVIVNAARLLPDDKTYYHYTGSLTTPPCTEEVKWYVMKTVLDISKKQLSTFTSLFPNNARPIQPLNGRVIQQLSR